MTAKLSEPTQEYIDKVKEAVKDLDDFQEEDVQTLLAWSCWRHNEPFKKEYFESETIQFSDDDKETLGQYITKLEEYLESQNQDPNFAEHAVHYHGSFSHDHEGGNESHTHSEHAGSYSKTAPSNSSEGDMPKFSEQVAEALGLAKDATSTQVMEAIGAIKASSFTEEQKSSFQDMQHNYAVNQYMEETQHLTAIPGTPKELAEKLTVLEEKTSKEIADERLADYKAAQEMANNAGVTQTLLKSKFSESDDETVGEAEAQIKKYAEDNKVDFPKALAHFATSDTKVFSAYYAEQNPTE